MEALEQAHPLNPGVSTLGWSGSRATEVIGAWWTRLVSLCHISRSGGWPEPRSRIRVSLVRPAEQPQLNPLLRTYTDSPLALIPIGGERRSD